MRKNLSPVYKILFVLFLLSEKIRVYCPDVFFLLYDIVTDRMFLSFVPRNSESQK